jgi:PIN domain nuclease of toxin-antitoxin system
MLNLDTHILIHALIGALTASEKAVLSRNRWGISPIVLWEITKLHQKRRLSFGLHSPQLLTILQDIQIWDLNAAVCQNILGLDFSGDPADEIIAATSLTHGVPLVTRDRRIRVSKVIEFAT